MQVKHQREPRTGKVVVKRLLDHQNRAARRERFETVAKNLMTAVIVKTMKNRSEDNNVRTLWIRAAEEVGRYCGESIPKAVFLNVLFRDPTHRGQVHHNSSQVRMPEADLECYGRGASPNVHHTPVRGEIKALSDILTLRNAERIHKGGESPETCGVFIEGGKSFSSRCAKRLLPAWTVFPKGIGKEFPHVVEGIPNHRERLERNWRLGCTELTYLRISEEISALFD